MADGECSAGSEVTVESEEIEQVRERIARALYEAGAWCGNCSFEGWDSCAECRQALLGYAVAVLDVLGLEQVGWFARFPSNIEAIQLAPFENDSDMGRQEPVYRLALSGSPVGETP